MAKNKANRNILEKGSYIHYQSGAFVQVKNFILATRSAKKCLLLQLTNSSEADVDSVKITLVQLNSIGNVITEDSFTYNLRIPAGGDAALESALVLKDGCTDFRVKIVYATSGQYKYLFKNGQSIQTYDPRGYKERLASGDGGTVTVKRRFEKSGRRFAFIAFIAIFTAIVAVAYVLLGSGLL